MEPQVDARDDCLARWSACPLDWGAGQGYCSHHGLAGWIARVGSSARRYQTTLWIRSIFSRRRSIFSWRVLFFMTFYFSRRRSIFHDVVLFFMTRSIFTTSFYLWMKFRSIYLSRRRSIFSRSGYSSVTGCMVTQATRPALQNLKYFWEKK